MNRKDHRFSLWKNTGLIKFRLQVVPWLLRLGRPLIFARRWLRPHKITLVKVESVDGQPPLAVLCSAASQNKNYFFRLAFGGPPRETVLGRVKLRDLFRPNFAVEKNCSLIVVETNQSHYDWLKQDGWFFIPAWVNGEVSLPIPGEFMKRDTVKSDLRKIRRNGFAYAVTHDEARFHDFHQQMHLPFIRKTHGEEALLLTYGESRKKCEAFDLVLVHQQSRPGHDLAGIMIVYDAAYPRLWSLGIREDGVDHVQEGIISALYHFSFEHLITCGVTRLNLGSSRALLRDGVLNFKRKLSQTITGGSWQGFALKIVDFTPGTKKFLLENPFIFTVGDQFHGAVFVADALSLERVQQIDKDCFHPGLTRLVIYTFRDEETFSPASLPPPLAGRVTIRRASELVTPPVSSSHGAS
jgi:hypothetical protein